MTKAINYIVVGGFAICILTLLSLGCGNDAPYYAKVIAPASATATVPSGTTICWDLIFKVVTTDDSGKEIPLNGVNVEVNSTTGPYNFYSDIYCATPALPPTKTDKLGVVKLGYVQYLPMGAPSVADQVWVNLTSGNNGIWTGTLTKSQ